MKIKKIGHTSFLISSQEISLITDPLMLLKAKGSFPKNQADIIFVTDNKNGVKKSILEDNKLTEKILPDHREKVFEITTSGEFEIGGLMIRRDLGKDFYVVDENTIRLLYLGGTGKDFDPEEVKNAGDVDVLIVPVGDGVNFMDFEKLEKVISNVDPAVLLPCAYKDEGIDSNLKSREEFIKYFGFADVKDDTSLTVTKKRVEEEEQSVDVIFL